MKLTKWFPGNVTPHRPGVYECDWYDMDWMGGRYFNEWDGQRWRYGRWSPKEHAKYKQKPVPHDIAERALRRWRGVRVDA